MRAPPPTPGGGVGPSGRPSIAAASTAADNTSRFAHLLQPIRDLAANWDVDLASELEEYLEALEHVTFSFGGDGPQLNFAEAALLIQGSTCVYGRKVEYLHALVHRALAHVADPKAAAAADGREGGGGGGGTRRAGGGPAAAAAAALAAAADDDAAFLALDAALEEAGPGVTDLDEGKDGPAPSSSSAAAAPRASARPPAVLLALDDVSAEDAAARNGPPAAPSTTADASAAGPNAAGAGSVTLRIAQLGVHAPSGALLLDPRDGDGLGPGLEAVVDVGDVTTVGSGGLGDGAALLEAAAAAQARAPLPLLAGGGGGGQAAPAPALSADDDGGGGDFGGAWGGGDDDSDVDGTEAGPPAPAAFGAAAESHPPVSLFSGGGEAAAFPAAATTVAGPPLPPLPAEANDPYAHLDPTSPSSLAVKPYRRLARPPPRRARGRADARALAASALTAAAVWAPSWAAAAEAHPAFLPPPPSRPDALTLTELAVYGAVLGRGVQGGGGARRRRRAPRASAAAADDDGAAAALLNPAAAPLAGAASEDDSDADGEGAGLDLIDGGDSDDGGDPVPDPLHHQSDADAGGWLDGGWGGGGGGGGEEPNPDGDDDGLSYEALVRAHVEALVAAAAAAGTRTALASRVAAWRDAVRPALEAGEAHGPFDMRAEGQAVLAGVRAAAGEGGAEGSGDEGAVAAPLAAALGGGAHPRWRVARLFAASLQLANARALAIVRGPEPGGAPVCVRPLRVKAAAEGGGGALAARDANAEGEAAAAAPPRKPRVRPARPRASGDGDASPPSSGNPAPKKRSRRPAAPTPGKGRASRGRASTAAA